MSRYYYVYILTNKNNTVLYIGATNNLKNRAFQHKEKVVEGFTKKFNVNMLVYYEQTENVESAIQREKQLKSWNRWRKVKLIVGFNPKWDDLFMKDYKVLIVIARPSPNRGVLGRGNLGKSQR